MDRLKVRGDRERVAEIRDRWCDPEVVYIGLPDEAQADIAWLADLASEALPVVEYPAMWWREPNTRFKFRGVIWAEDVSGAPSVALHAVTWEGMGALVGYLGLERPALKASEVSEPWHPEKGDGPSLVPHFWREGIVYHWTVWPLAEGHPGYAHFQARSHDALVGFAAEVGQEGLPAKSEFRTRRQIAQAIATEAKRAFALASQG